VDSAVRKHIACTCPYVTVPKQSLSQVLPQRPFASVFECCLVSPSMVVIASAALGLSRPPSDGARCCCAAKMQTTTRRRFRTLQGLGFGCEGIALTSARWQRNLSVDRLSIKTCPIVSVLPMSVICAEIDTQHAMPNMCTDTVATVVNAASLLRIAATPFCADLPVWVFGPTFGTQLSANRQRHPPATHARIEHRTKTITSQQSMITFAWSLPEGRPQFV
jgi:hypothetical protein